MSKWPTKIRVFEADDPQGYVYTIVWQLLPTLVSPSLGIFPSRTSGYQYIPPSKQWSIDGHFPLSALTRFKSETFLLAYYPLSILP